MRLVFTFVPKINVPDAQMRDKIYVEYRAKGAYTRTHARVNKVAGLGVSKKISFRRSNLLRARVPPAGCFELTFSFSK